MKPYFFTLLTLLLTCSTVKSQVFDYSQFSVSTIDTTIKNNQTILLNQPTIVPLTTRSFMQENINNGMQIPIIKPPRDTSTFIIDTMLPPIIPPVIPPITYAVGEIPIQENMSPLGGKIYNVPINVIPGRNGLQPNLALTYNSQGGSGVAGAGWSLSGASMITRINKSIYYDNKAEAIAWGKDCAFSLDGTQLVKISQTSDAINYETEQGHIKVKGVLNFSRSDIIYFEVLYTNGMIGVFGWQNGNKEISYPLTHLSDSYGNYITYEYLLQGGQYYLNKISYGATSQDDLHFASVKIAYKIRNDVNSFYIAGEKITNNYIIDSIACFSELERPASGDKAIYSYNMTYGVQQYTNTALLKQIDYKIEGNAIRPLVFTYGEANISSVFQKDTTSISSYFNIPNDSLNIRKGKFNLSDSFEDAFIVYPRKNPYVGYHKDSWLFGHSQNYFVNEYHPDQKILVSQDLNSSFCFTSSLTCGTGFIDILTCNVKGEQGDQVVKINNYINGSTEQLIFTLYVPTYYASLALQQTTTLSLPVSMIDADGNKSVVPKFYRAGNFIGNGKDVIFAISLKNPMDLANIPSRCYLFDINTNTILYNQPSFDFEGGDIIIVDFDGDGKADICHITSTGVDIYTFTISNGVYGLTKILSYAGLKKGHIEDRKFLIGDINGDGKTDFLLSPAYSYNQWQTKTILVSTYSNCPSCGKSNPDANTICAQCGRGLLGATNCYSCNSTLTSCPGGGIIGGLDPLLVAPGDFGHSSGHNCCPIHGQNITVNNFIRVDKGNQWKLFTSKGANGFEEKIITIGDCESKDQYAWADVNGDGLSDLVRFRNGVLKTHLSCNGTIKQVAELAGELINSQSILVSSNVPHKHTYTSIVGIDKDKFYKISFTRNDTKQQLLTKVVNSMGVESINEYAKLGSVTNQYFVPQSPTPLNVVFPYVVTKMPLWVLEKNHIILNNTTLSSTGYIFNDLVAHLQGRGICGFESMITANLMTGKAAVQFYNPLNYGTLVGEDAPGIAKVTYEYNPIVPNTYKQIDITLHKKTVLDRFTNTSSTHTYSYNNYGHPINEIIDYGDGTNVTTNISYYIASPNIYLPETQLVTRTNPNGQYSQKTVLTYNNYLKPIKKQEYVKASTRSSEQKIGETVWTYDNVGNLTSEKITPYNTSTSYTSTYQYDNNARFLTKKIDRRGLETKYNFSSPRGLLNWEEDYLGHRTSYSYNTLGELINITTPDGREIEHQTQWDTLNTNAKYYSRKYQANEPEEIVYYDALHREIKTGKQDFNGNWIYAEKAYDNRGQLSHAITPAGTTTYIYDDYNRVQSITEPTGSSASYTYNGLSVSETKNGLTTTTSRNVWGETISVASPDGTISYNLRADGQPSSINAGGVVTSFEYDDYGRRSKITDPSAGNQIYLYNNAGLLWKQTNAKNQTTVMLYDSLGQMITKQSYEFTVSYGYRYDGLLLTQSNGLHLLSYQYDQYNRPVVATETIGSKSFVTEYTYNGPRLEKISYPTLDYSVEYQYNTYGFADLIIAKEDNGNAIAAKAIEYDCPDPSGATTYTSKFANNFDESRIYNPLGLQTQFELKGSSDNTNITENYEYDLQKKLLSGRLYELKRERVIGGITFPFRINNEESYTYDIHQRLTGHGLQALKSVQYDNKGNITHKTGVGDYNYNSGKPFALTTLSNSDTSAIPPIIQDIGYTSFMRPAFIQEGNNRAYFDYGISNNRCRMEVYENNNKLLTRYYFAGGKFELTDYYTNGMLDSTDRILYADGSPYTASIAYTPDRAETHHYIHRDRLGSVRHISNTEGQIVATYYYDAWGRQTYDEGIPYSAYKEPRLLFGRGYTGHEHLPWFNLINMNARLYDPVVGRFLSPDPYVQAPDYLQNFNRYSYCLNNPVMFIDPDGEIVWWLVPVITAAVYAIGNTVAHAIRGDIRDIGDFGKYFFQGAVTGFALGCAWQFAPLIPGIGQGIQTAMTVYAFGQVGIGTMGMIGGAINDGWSGMGRAGKLFLGNFYLNEQEPWLGMWQGFSRHTWEMLNTFVGQGYTQGRNAMGNVSRVDYFGGATFATLENSNKRNGVSLGNFININIKGEITGSFDERVLTDPLFMHEYGHTFDSRLFGPLYLPAIGIPSASGASWTEIRANRHAKRYFRKRPFFVNWDEFEQRYPTK